MNNIYYIDETTKQQFGPFDINQLAIKNIRPTTMVWASGMEDWAQAQNVKELDFLFSANPTGAPSPTTQSPNMAPPIPLAGMQTPPDQNYQSRFASNVYGQPLNAQNMPVEPMPKTWLVESILFTVLCCSPFTIAGIVYAAKVEKLYKSGDYYSALEASKSAKLWTLIGIGLAVFGFIAYAGLIAIGVMSEL